MKMDSTPLVSVIIVNYNGKKFLKECLESLMLTTYPKFEVILVDNNSSDDSIEFVMNNYPSVIIIKLEKNYGFAEPNNIGAKIAKGDFLLFLNNDTSPTPEFMTELVNAMQKNSEIAICQSLLLRSNDNIDSSGDFIDTLGRPYSSKDKPVNMRRILSARAASMMIKKNIFLKLDGFDKNFFVSFEDVDLGWRANIWGYGVFLVPTSIVFHKGGKTVEKIAEEIQFHGVKNFLTFRLTNFELPYALKSTTSLFFMYFMRKIFGTSIVSDPEFISPLPKAKILLKSSFWVLRNLGYIYKKKKRINSQRVKTTKNLIEVGLITPV
jgi:GT2 family glycosyltransferase